MRQIELVLAQLRVGGRVVDQEDLSWEVAEPKPARLTGRRSIA
jgi:hypothetical protein